MIVLTCASGFDPSTGNCDGVTAWVEIPDQGTSLIAMLPTMEQANTVGIAMFVSLALMVAVRDLITPSKNEE